MLAISQQGENTITYYATDDKGRDENHHTTRVDLDNRAPAVAITSRTGNMKYAQWRATCPASSATGGVCGTATDTAGNEVNTTKNFSVG